MPGGALHEMRVSSSYHAARPAAMAGAGKNMNETRFFVSFMFSHKWAMVTRALMMT